jgi:ATP/maltotriose-dependent transcriptional regulator MalT
MAPAGLIKRRITVPALPEQLVARERLETRLAASIAHARIVIVSATAGAGKTTAVVRALGRLDRDVSWVTLSAADQAPGRLLTYVEASLRPALPEDHPSVQQLLVSGVTHVDAAALLLEGLIARPGVLVLDEVDRLQPSAPAWRVIEALVDNAPEHLAVVLVSRRPVQLTSRVPAYGQTEWVLEDDLAFDADEVAAVLELAGSHGLEPSDVMSATSGWVTGVIFDAWRRSDATTRLGGATDPLHGYLATQILEELPPADQQFLITTSVLDEVTESRARALGITDSAQRLGSLRDVNLPGTWAGEGTVFRCHSRFREFLLSRLDAEPAEQAKRVYRRLGRLLITEELPEEAVEAFLRADALSEAADAAVQALPQVLDRLDLDVADRWLRTLRLLERPPIALLEGEVIVAAGREDVARIVRIAEQMDRDGRVDELVANSSRAAAWMAWAWAHAGRLDEIPRILDRAPRGAEMAAIGYMLHLIEPQPDSAAPVPQLNGGPLDALVIRDHYIYGRLDRVLSDTRTGWVGAVSTPWRIAALRAVGRVSEAAALLDAAHRSGLASLGLDAVVGPEVLLDGGDARAAMDLADAGLPLARDKGSELFACINRCVAAKIAVRGLRDAPLALSILEELATHGAARYRYVDELMRTWRGFALLVQARNEEALADLESATRSMVEGDRILELPTAAVLLSEARWRAGDESGADDAADLALRIARRQGANHLLLQALLDFPLVLSRRLDAEPTADSPWHDLSRSLRTQSGPRSDPDAHPPVHLQDLGKPALLIDAAPVRTRISKAVELLAFLLAAPDHRSTRSELMEALLDARADDSARSYLRQALHWLRNALPPGFIATTDDGEVRLACPEAIGSDSAAAVRHIREAERMQGGEQLRQLTAGLRLLAQGDYLAGCGSAWAATRRDELRRLADEARHTAARLAFDHGALVEAQDLIDDILRDDPYRESVWRLRMRVVGALGDETEVIDSFRRCREALAELGANVAPATSALLDALRR